MDASGVANVLEVHGLRKRYGNIEALKGVDITVEAGEVFGFLGPNGAGKTTFTKCVTGFVRPDAGTVRLLGQDALADPPGTARHIGLVPDQYDFYSNLSGRQHLDFYGRLAGMEREDRSARIEEVLGLVGMSDRADSRVKGYSHGMKQRICIGQAILHRPKLIFFDEPTNGLDPKGAYELREMIKGLARDGTAVFLNSHQLHEVETTCKRVAILDKGELKIVAPVDQLRKRAGAGAQVRVHIDNPTQKHHAALQSSGATAIKLDANIASFSLDDERVPDAVAALVGAGARVRSVESAGASLESVFLELTGGATPRPREVAA